VGGLSEQPGEARPALVVLCAADARPQGLEPIERRMTVRYTDADGLADAIVGADALLLWDFFSSALESVWDRADRLAWVHVAAAGVDRMLFEGLVDSAVTVTNARGVFDRPMAEFALMSVLAHAKDMLASHQLQSRHEWRHRETRSVAGRRALVVGTGAIGRETARLLRRVDMQVRGAGRAARVDDPDFDTVVSSAELAEHVGWADYVIVITPLTDQTRGLVDRRVLAAMKPSAYLVNLGRGPCVVEDDLIRAIGSGQIDGAALDVFDVEPLPPGHPLWTTPRVTITPHISGDAHGWLDTLARQFVENAERFLDGRPLRNVVDKRLGFVPPTDEG
jgi:phosphoglycerate dehydrogenase-like enzyme